MNPVEIAYKIILDIVMAGLIWVIFFNVATPWNIIIVLAIAHTINWLLNCQPVALMWHLDWGRNNPHDFITHIEGLHERLGNQSYLQASAAYGSLSIGNYKPTSDIDIRVIMRPGIINQLRAANFCFLERVRAAWHRFPLDLYAFTLGEVLRKMNPKEPPILFYDPDGILLKSYPKTVKFEEFTREFHKRLDQGDFD